MSSKKQPNKMNEQVFIVFNGCTFNHFHNIQDSVVVQDCNCNGNVTVSNGTNNQLDDMEREVLRMFRAFPMRTKIEGQSYFYSLEDRLKEAERHAAKK